jgi:PD-(D/E)XK nuclease superfamily
MTYTYNEIETTNDLGLRWYHTPNGAYPSITTILGITRPEEAKQALSNWRTSLGAEKADAVSKKATDRGTNVHLLAERYLRKQEVFAPIHGKTVIDSDKAAFNAIKLKLDRIDEIWGQEVPLFSRKYEVAGRCDLVGKYKGVPVIIDFKTAGRVKHHKDIGEYKLQLAFYAQAHNEMFGTDIRMGVIIMVAETGFPMEFNVPLEPEYPELQKRVDAFWVKTLNTLQ